MNTSECIDAKAKHTISLFFPEAKTLSYGEIPSVNLDLNVRHNSNFMCDSIEKTIKEAQWNTRKQTITTKILCLSNYNGALNDGTLLAFDFLHDINVPLKLVKLSCEFDVKFDLEMTDDGVYFNLIDLVPDISSVNIQVNLALRSNEGRLKSIKYHNFSLSDIEQEDRIKLQKRLSSGIYRDCFEKELFTSSVVCFSKNPDLYRASTTHKLTENNFKFLEEALTKEVGSSVWGMRSMNVLQVAYNMILHVKSVQNLPYIAIKDFTAFLELDILQTAMITSGGMDENPVKAVADLKNYLITLPGFDSESSCLSLGQPSDVYKQHGFIIMEITSLINDITHKSLWVD